MQALHTVISPDGGTLANQGQIILGSFPGIANVVGGGAGAAVVTAVAIANLPANYSVAVNPGQDATWFVSGKTTTGFNVTLSPRLAANTLAAGTFDVIITG
jgi:hypothetical protein